MEEQSAQLQAIDKAIEYANVDEFEASLAWSNIALAIVENNKGQVSDALALAAYQWLKNPTEESFANMSQVASFYERILNETQV